MEKEARNRVKSFILRLSIVLVSFGVYAAVSLLFSHAGFGILYLLLIPVALSGALFGIPGGLVGAVVGYLESEVLYRVAFPIFQDYTVTLWILDLAITIFVGVMTGYLSLVIRRQKSLIEQLKTTVQNKEILIKAIETAQETIEALNGVIPVCSYCNRLRITEDKWGDWETFCKEHTDMQLSHVICPECAKQHKQEYRPSEKPKCPLFNLCAFFHRPITTVSHFELKNLYCYMGYQKCQIFNRVDIGRPVPQNLLPDGIVNNFSKSRE